jgi:ribonuclease HI
MGEGVLQLADSLDINHKGSIEQKFNINLQSMENGNRIPINSQYTVYTDGSKIENRVGAGYVIYKQGTEEGYDKLRLPDSCTVFQAEIRAIQEAAMCLARQNSGQIKYVKIITDSQAALQALASRHVKQETVYKAIETLNTLCSGSRYVTICWTKAHVGTTGNERADVLAKEGAREEIIKSAAEPSVTVKRKVEEKIEGIWGSEWREYNGGRMSKQFIREVSQKISKQALVYGRYKASRLIRLISGHNALNYFRSRIDNSINSKCRFCNEEDETFWHLCTECPVFREARVDVFLDNDPYSGCWNVDQLLQFSEYNKIDEAISGETDCEYTQE